MKPQRLETSTWQIQANTGVSEWLIGGISLLFQPGVNPSAFSNALTTISDRAAGADSQWQDGLVA